MPRRRIAALGEVALAPLALAAAAAEATSARATSPGLLRRPPLCPKPCPLRHHDRATVLQRRHGACASQVASHVPAVGGLLGQRGCGRAIVLDGDEDHRRLLRFREFVFYVADRIAQAGRAVGEEGLCPIRDDTSAANAKSPPATGAGHTHLALSHQDAHRLARRITIDNSSWRGFEPLERN